MSNTLLLSPVNNVEQLNNDAINHTSAYAENPLTHSIRFILFLDFMERFAFNGVIFTMPGYLTGYYEPYWNPNYAPFQANTYIATFQGIGFVTPFIVAFIADCLIGDYWTINMFTSLCLIPGILLIAISSIPYSGESVDFPLDQLKLGTHILFPLGFGAAKTLYGVYAQNNMIQLIILTKSRGSLYCLQELNLLGVFWVHWYQLSSLISSRLTKAAPMDWS
mmetsp:Transcript_11324/g.18733  ORF Transcript_11324/g.18733 Transcript_11324/m.18733 type:complete len:221 (-) Transcript_11324:1238-1900(-)